MAICSLRRRDRTRRRVIVECMAQVMLRMPEVRREMVMTRMDHGGICHGGGAAGGTMGGGLDGGCGGSGCGATGRGGANGGGGAPGGGVVGGANGGSDGRGIKLTATVAAPSDSTGVPISALRTAAVRPLRPRSTPTTSSPLLRLICVLTVTLDAATVSSMSVVFTPACRAIICAYSAASKLSRVVPMTAVIETTIR